MESGNQMLEIIYNVQGKELKTYMSQKKWRELQEWSKQREKELGDYFYGNKNSIDLEDKSNGK